MTAVEASQRLSVGSASIFSFLAGSYVSASDVPPSYHTEELFPPPPAWLYPQTWATIPLLRTLTVQQDHIQLTLENGKIYHNTPSNALYRLPRALTWTGNDISLFRSAQASPGVSRNQLLYNMKRIPFTQKILLETTRTGLSSATMRGRKSLRSVMHWEVQVHDDAGTVLHYYKGKWKNQSGDVLAQERGSSAQGTTLKLNIQNLRYRLDLIDLIIAAWTARMWQSNAPWSRNPALYWADSDAVFEEKKLMFLPIVYLFQAVSFRK